MSRFARLVARDLRLALSGGADAGIALAFFVICVTLFPFGVGPEPNILARIAAGVIWISALLASLLSMDRLFAGDYEDGSLDLFATGPLPLEAVVAAKIVAHWLVTGLPLVVMSPLMGLFLNLPTTGTGVLLLTLLIGTPILSLVGAIGAGLILGARRGGVLLSLLVLPLFIPPLIFAIGAIEAQIAGLTPRPHLLLLGGLLALALPLSPIAAAAGVRQALQ